MDSQEEDCSSLRHFVQLYLPPGYRYLSLHRPTRLPAAAMQEEQTERYSGGLFSFNTEKNIDKFVMSLSYRGRIY